MFFVPWCKETGKRVAARLARALLKGGENGPVFDLENPAASRLLKAVRYDDPQLQMPPDGKKLPDQEVAVIARWIAQGAPRRTTRPADKPTRPKQERRTGRFNPFGREPCPA